MATSIQNATIQQTSATAPYSLKSLLDAFKLDTQISINCHHIGTIESFDPGTQTASATINYTRTSFQYDPSTNANVAVQVKYPVLMNCPVICLGGGLSSMTFPIKAGDECLILFNDRSLDNWLQSGSFGPVNSPRLHSISDGIIIVGLRNSQRSIQNYDTDRAVIRSGSAAVGVRGDTNKVLITGAYPSDSITLNSELQSLITQLQNLCTAIAAITVTTSGVTSTIPNNAASFPIISSSLQTIASALGVFLE